MERDGIAAYYLMLRWIATNDTAHAEAHSPLHAPSRAVSSIGTMLEAAERVLDAWSGKLTAFAGRRHSPMCAHCT
jgi:hypothetical protein